MRLPFRGVKAAAAPAPADASVSAPTIAHRFNFDWAYHQDEFTDEDTYWWYAVDVRVDPSEVWAEDEEGNLWVVPFSTDGADDVTFGTPVRSRLTAVPVAAADGVAATAAVSRRRQRVLATNLDRPEKPGRNQAAASAGPDNKRTPMDDTVRQALARQHGLDPETATEEQVNVAVIAAGSEPTEPTEPTEPAEPEAPVAEIEQADLEPVAANAASTDVRAALGLPSTATDEQVRARVAELEANAAAGAAARDQQVRTERDQLVDAAVSDGRIAPSARDAWRQALDARPEVETPALAALSPGRVPVRERGATPDAAASGRDNDSLRRAMAFAGLDNGRRESAKEVTRRG